MNYVKVINKAEILLYSSLISIMSGINRLKDQEQEIPKFSGQEISQVDSGQVDGFSTLPARVAFINWDNVQQAFLSLLLWMLLGLAAGFLLGMLDHG